MQRAEMRDEGLCDVPKVSTVMRSLTWSSLQSDLPTMPLSHASILHSVQPPFAYALFYRLANLCIGIDYPYPIGRIEGDAEELRVRVDDVLNECQGVLARVCHQLSHVRTYPLLMS